MIKIIYYDDTIEDIYNYDTNMKELKLSYNNIKEIRGLENLYNLEVLYLDNNKITDINKLGLKNLTNLKVLNLSNNQIINTSGLEILASNLQILYLQNNQITDENELENLTDLTNLQVLDLGEEIIIYNIIK